MNKSLKAFGILYVVGIVITLTAITVSKHKESVDMSDFVKQCEESGNHIGYHRYAGSSPPPTCFKGKKPEIVKEFT